MKISFNETSRNHKQFIDMMESCKEQMILALGSQQMDIKPKLYGVPMPSKGVQNTGSSSKISMKRGLEALNKSLVKSNKRTSSKSMECEASKIGSFGMSSRKPYSLSTSQKRVNGTSLQLRKGGAIGQSKIDGIKSI